MRVYFSVVNKQGEFFQRGLGWKGIWTSNPDPIASVFYYEESLVDDKYTQTNLYQGLSEAISSGEAFRCVPVREVGRCVGVKHGYEIIEDFAGDRVVGDRLWVEPQPEEDVLEESNVI